MSEYLFYEKTAEKWLNEAEALENGTPGALYSFVRRLVRSGEDAGFSGNLWQAVLTEQLMLDENVYSLAAERNPAPKGSLSKLIRLEAERIRTLFLMDLEELGRRLEVSEAGIIADYHPSLGEKRLSLLQRDHVLKLRDNLAEAGSATSFLDTLCNFYTRFGVGDSALSGAFSVTDEGELQPVFCPEQSSLDQLVGYERQKRMLTDNTTAFLAGRRANNCLLYGEAGTGKSSSIRALLHKYFDQGLRIVEVSRQQYRLLPSLIAKLSKRNYRWIIYLDDLSFEEFEVEYKYLKAVIEGGLSERPGNVLIYATSNRRHLVRERFDDRPESPLDKHKNETVQEKLSLFGRFGICIFYGAPEKKEYLHIVKELAARGGLKLPEEELEKEALRWEIEHGGKSGRTAVQLVDHLRGSGGGANGG